MVDINFTNRKVHQNLTGLFAFYLVARQGNFTGAAQSLGLTQSSISQRIKNLEMELGIQLFRREHRGVTLTHDGVRLLEVVKPAMKSMQSSVANLIERKSRPRVRISVDFAFATFWLLPRLAALRARMDDEFEIQILASQVPPSTDEDNCDILIHVAKTKSMRPGDVLLLPERVAAVCSPAFLTTCGPLAGPEDLLDTQLLSLSRPRTAQWQTWQGWFDSLGIVDKRSRNFISFNTYDMVTQAAVAGEGVALGWLGLIDGLLQQGNLVKAIGHVVDSDAGYVMSEDRHRSSRTSKKVFDWIAEQIDVAVA